MTKGQCGWFCDVVACWRRCAFDVFSTWRTGAAHIHHILLDPVVVPAEARGWTSEARVYLPHTCVRARVPHLPSVCLFDILFLRSVRRGWLCGGQGWGGGVHASHAGVCRYQANDYDVGVPRVNEMQRRSARCADALGPPRIPPRAIVFGNFNML